MIHKLKILHLEDMPSDAELVGRELKRGNIDFDKLLVDTREEYTTALKEFKPDIVLSDHSLPEFNSLEALKILKSSGLNIPFILITATISEEFAVSVMKEGATDYILKDRMQRLPNAVVSAMEKHRIETERRQASEELSQLFNTIDEVYFSTDMVSYKTIRMSPASESIFGYTPAEIINDDSIWQRIIHPEDQLLHGQNIEKYRAGHKIIFQYRIIHKDQSVRWLESKVIPELSSKGELLRVYGVSRDITARKLADDHIQEKQNQIEEILQHQGAILNALPAKIVLINENGKIMAVNEAWKKNALATNLGIPRYGIGFSYTALAATATEVNHATAEKINKGIKEVIAHTLPEFTLEYKNVHGNWYQVIVAPLADHDQKGAVVLHIDISDRKKAQESLIHSEANLRSIFESTDLSIVMVDADLKIISYNHNAYDSILKLLHKKLKVDQQLMKYFPLGRKKAIKNAIQLLEKQQAVGYEVAFDLPDGNAEWLEVRWNCVMGPKANMVGYIVTFQCITDKKRAELERNSMTADLIKRNQDMEQFTYIISHNLRAPVANIKGLSELLRMMETDEMDCSEILGALSTSVNNLDNIILDLNQILQINNQVANQIEQVLLPVMVNEIEESIKPFIKESNTTIISNFEITEILTLKSYVYSIFQNLIINSIKYKRADADPVIIINSWHQANKVCLTFKDNGSGIDLTRYGKQVFGLYKRFHHGVEGKGMGLFMVKMQVERLGGKINIESEPGNGTTFTIELPAA